MISSNPAVVAEFQARLQVLKLRRAGLSFTAISVVLSEYHGIDRKPRTWAKLCHDAGIPVKRQGNAEANFQ